MVANELGFEVLPEHADEVLEAVKNRPGLAKIRELLPTWKHVVDSIIAYRIHKYILLIDTDVFVAQPVYFPDQELDFIYNCDDIPGFRGKWYLPFKEPMVPAINPGFMLLNPRAIDLDWLDWLVSRYFLGSRNYWWTRQAALAVIVGHSQKRGIFSGEDVRVVSGNYKRTPEEIRNNCWKLYGDSRPIEDEALVRACFEGGAVLHCAGSGKKWLRLAEDASHELRELPGHPARNASYFERCLLAARMLYNSL